VQSRCHLSAGLGVAHHLPVTTLSFATDIHGDADGTLLLSGGQDGTLRVWDVRMDLRCVNSVLSAADPVCSLSMSVPYIVAGRESSVQLIDLRQISKPMRIAHAQGMAAIKGGRIYGLNDEACPTHVCIWRLGSDVSSQPVSFFQTTQTRLGRKQNSKLTKMVSRNSRC